MSRLPFAALERRFLAELPPGAVDPARVPEFEAALGSAAVEAADAAALLAGIVPPADLAAAVGRMARIVVDAVEDAAERMGLAGHPWCEMACRWAVGRFFARLREVIQAGAVGGRA